ncbi:MAG: DUF4097 domain-containing protein [Bacteroidetes bacterium]|nr:DUF4097 domain-containing protein [Bacteroidota bacterium]
MLGLKFPRKQTLYPSKRGIPQFGAKIFYLIAFLIPISACFTFSATGSSDSLKSEYREIKTQIIHITNLKKVVACNDYGNITAEVMSDSSECIKIIKRTKAWDSSNAQRALDNVKVIMEQDSINGILYIRTKNTRSDGFSLFHFLFGKLGGENDADVSYYLSIPSTTNLDLRTINGSIYVRDWSANLNVSTTNGNIKLDSIAGPLNLTSTNGNILVSIPHDVLSEGLTASTVNGSITIYCPSTICVDLGIQSVTGNIRIDFSITLSEWASWRNFTGKIGEGGSPWRVYTTNGDIRILRY